VTTVPGIAYGPQPGGQQSRRRPAPSIPLTGQQYQIAAGRYRAMVTELGAGLRELLSDDQPVIAGYQADELPPGGAGQLLAPWPNRIDGGRYAFGGSYEQALRVLFDLDRTVR